MPEIQNENDANNRRDGLALILGGIFILGLVFATYTYFNKSVVNNTDLSSEETSALDKLKDIIASKTERNDDKTGTDKNTLADKGEVKGTDTTKGTTVNATEWVATNYVKGDIQPGSYTVKKGDTLWEIAEAVYGNGAQWTKILAANSSSIGFLPNGSQALIVTGQVLVIPTP